MSERNTNQRPMGGRFGGARGGGFGRPVEKAKDFKGSLKRLIRYLRPHKINFIVVLIFAIASTAFTIAAPKVTSKAMNKLQDGYMARTMLKELGKAQNESVDQLNDKMAEGQKEFQQQINGKMADGQKKAVDEITNKMADAQKTTVDQIDENMADAQSKAVDTIYQSMAKQLYLGVASGQKKAVNQIVAQLAAAQKAMVTEISKQMQASAQSSAAAADTSGAAPAGTESTTAASGSTASAGTESTAPASDSAPAVSEPTVPSQQLDPETLQSIQKLMQLPMIDSLKDTNKKIQTSLQLIDILSSMPSIPGSTANGSMNPKTLGSLKEMLQLPMLGSVKSGSQKAAVVRKFLAISKTLPGSSGQSSMQLDTKTMNKVINTIPRIRSFSQTSQSQIKTDKKTTNAVQNLLKLPLLSTIKDPNEKNKDLIKLIDIFMDMPQMGTGSQSSQTAEQMDPKTLETLKKLIALPMISSIEDPQKKLDTTLALISIFKELPQIDSLKGDASQETQIDPDALNTVKELLLLPSLDTIRDPNERTAVLNKMVDLFIQMPDMNTGSNGSQSSELEMDPDALKSIQRLIALPPLDTIKDPQKKKDALIEMLDIFSSMPKTAIEQTGGGTDANSLGQIDSESIKTLEEYLKLPKLSTLTDPDQKADVSKKIMDLGKKLQSTMKDAPQNPKDDVKFTDDQINAVIKAIRETNGQYDFHYIGMIALILIGMYLVSAFFSLLMGLVMSGVSQKTVRDLRREIDNKLARLPLKYFDMHPHGDILSRVTNDVDTIATTLQQSLTQIITSVITIIGYIIMMLTISPALTLIVIGTLPLYIIATALIARKSQKYFAAQQKELGALSGHVEEMYTGHKIVKAFGREKDSIEKFESINARLNGAGWKAQFVSGIMFPVMNFVSNLGYVGISIVGGIWITRSLLGLGDILAFIQYSRSFTMPIVQTSNIANVIQSTVACAERVFEVLDEQEESPDRKDAFVLENPRGEVKFEHVDFRYKEDTPLIENMNLEAKPGDTIAIVGPTGAGKTTLVNLLMRFYEINGGRISIDGVDIKNIKRSELRKMFGMVLQDTWVFNGTIKDNIAYGTEGASMEEIVEAAKAAHADHFIRTLPDGYDTILNEEASNISQGQKQLLTIARAILANPRILILDEATSSVDTRTEVLIQKAMANLMKGRTSFVIAHRLSTIRDAEMILVMNHGSIIEMGNHKELLAEDGFYADLYNSQFAGAALDDAVAV